MAEYEIWFSEVVLEESNPAAETQDYFLKMRKGENTVYTVEGWQGLIFHKPLKEGENPTFVDKTHIFKERENALRRGCEMMNKRQSEWDKAMAKN